MNFSVTFKGGRIRTEQEHSKLLTQAGFRIEKTVLTESEVSVLSRFSKVPQ